MLFKITISRVELRKIIFGRIKKEIKNNEYLISAETESQIEEYFDCMPTEGTTRWTSAWTDENRPWVEERTWKKVVNGDDNDAHLLLLISPTGVMYTHRLRYN